MVNPRSGCVINFVAGMALVVAFPTDLMSAIAGCDTEL